MLGKKIDIIKIIVELTQAASLLVFILVGCRSHSYLAVCVVRVFVANPA